jgi:C4-dicarboxylate transporter
LHSFISYTVPVQVPYVETVIKTVATSAPATSTTTTAQALASAAGLGDLVKKILFRAAGEEGLAENIAAKAVKAAKAAEALATTSSTTYKTEYQTVPCVDTSGETFAIWLNVLYLTPLTVLFVRFFIRSYMRRSSSAKSVASKKTVAGATNGTARANGHTNGHAH